MKQGQELAALNVSIPRLQKEWVEGQVVRGGYGTVSEYIRELIRSDQAKRADAEIEQKLLGAMDSGPATELTRHDWSRMREEVLRRIRQRKSGRNRKS